MLAHLDNAFESVSLLDEGLPIDLDLKSNICEFSKTANEV